MKHNKNLHRMKVVRTGEEHEMEYIPTAEMLRNPTLVHSLALKEDTPDEECRLALDQRCQINLDRTGNPFHHMAADGTIVTPDPTISYYLSRIPMDDQEYICNMWQQYIKPDVLPAVPVDEHWYDKHPITLADLVGSSGRFK